ncbi:hypothetical protein PG994_000781 [Apiospora phragmitis]|uniref:N-acetyltransferase domain-containing protein n=1 Tax=Apiospora phragmitis TaxID=2905665 RepID=A0ABR1X7B1_9PEZI
MPKNNHESPSQVEFYTPVLSWLWQIRASGCENEVQIASCDANLIERNRIRPSFWQEMNEGSMGTSDLAFGLFDRYGRVSRKYVDPGFRRGTGAWGRELDRGDILFIDELTVYSQASRRRGVGTKLVEEVLKHVRRETGQKIHSAVLGVGYLNRYVDGTDTDEAMRHLTISRRFWRSLGFRRIGTSRFYAFTDDVGHPSRHLDSSEDWDPPQHKPAISHDVLRASAILLSLTTRTPNEEDLRQLEGVFRERAEDKRWFATLASDESSNTVLHLDAMERGLEVMKYIATRCPDLAAARNKEGETPFEALIVSRGSTNAPLPVSGSSLGGTEVFDLTQLSRKKISHISSAADEQARLIHPEADAIRYSLRLRYGCTCGECIGGFLSPRMREMLIGESVALVYEDWDMMDEKCWLSPGIGMLLGQVNKCLHKSMIPNEKNIVESLSHEERHILENFLEEGSTVGSVATTFFEKILSGPVSANALNQSRQGTATNTTLPECRNDLELGFVSGMCGYKRVSPGRQYYHDAEKEEEDDEDYDDDYAGYDNVF